MNKKLSKGFDEEFEIMRQVDRDEVVGVFGDEEDREAVKQWIDKNFITIDAVIGLVERLSKRREVIYENTASPYYSGDGYNEAIDDILDILSLLKELKKDDR